MTLFHRLTDEQLERCMDRIVAADEAVTRGILTARAMRPVPDLRRLKASELRISEAIGQIGYEVQGRYEADMERDYESRHYPETFVDVDERLRCVVANPTDVRLRYEDDGWYA